MSVTVMLPLRAPSIVGVNVTVIMQLAPASTVLPQVFVSVKSPLAMMLEIVSVPFPVFESVAVCGALFFPTFSLPKLRLVGARFTCGVPTPYPLGLQSGSGV